VNNAKSFADGTRQLWEKETVKAKRANESKGKEYMTTKGRLEMK